MNPEKMTRRDFLRLGVAAAAVVAVDVLEPLEALASPDTRYNAPLTVWHGDLKKRNVYPTVDDCWDPRNVEKIAQAAIDNGIRFTFCPIGKVISRSPALYKDLILEGFDIENHTQNHVNLTRLTKADIKREILLARSALRKAAKQDVPQHFVRPPGGSGATANWVYPPLKEAAQELGYKLLMWNVSSAGTSYGAYSATPYQVGVIERNVENRLSNGMVSLQHAINVDTAAFSHIIKYMKEHGWNPIPVSSGIK